MTAEKSGKDGREGWGYNKLSDVGVSQLPAVHDERGTTNTCK
jgi:hypothetical protein